MVRRLKRDLAKLGIESIPIPHCDEPRLRLFRKLYEDMDRAVLDA